jgi:glycerol-3-phosphate dehydrogenase (NAD(P)+)
MNTIAVLGAGSWGTALAVHLARIGHEVRLWARDRVLAQQLSTDRLNPVYLPDVPLPDGVTPTASVEQALRGAQFVLAAVPSHGLRTVMRAASPFVAADAAIVSAVKGLEADTLLRMSEVIAQELGPPHPIVVLSGPSFAAEFARQLPTAVCVASETIAHAECVQTEFRSPYFRLYTGADVVGVEFGGALKNVIAIAAGVVEGLGLGHNALAALMTRGLAEVSRLACAAGARRETLAGLAGLGDLILTCTGPYSRNRRVGLDLAQGRALPEILSGMRMVAEGVRTTSVALALGTRYGVELPITTQMAEVLAGRKAARAAVEDLMLRPQRIEAER